MNPILFPFTFLPELEASGLAACFDRCTVCLPSRLQVPGSMSALADEGLISLAYPFEKRDAHLEKILKSLDLWANLHGPGHLRQNLGVNSDSFNNDESSAFRLVDQMRRYPDKSDVADKIDPQSEWILQSRLFLQIAQEFDERNQTLQSDLDVVASIAHRFQQELHATSDGIDDQPSPLTKVESDTDRSYMLSERMAAWLCFLSAPASPYAETAPNTFVTTSPAIEEQLLYAITELKPVGMFSQISTHARKDSDARQWRNDLDRWLSDLVNRKGSLKAAAAPQPPPLRSETPTVSLTVYYANQSPPQWFSHAAGNTNIIQQNFGDMAHEQTTLLACVKNE